MFTLLKKQWCAFLAYLLAACQLSVFSLFCLFANAAHAEFQFRSVASFHTLADFKSVASFEKNIAQYENACLANYAASDGGMHCFIAQPLWDRELNIYYKKLLAQLDKRKDQQGKKALIKSQRTWLKMVAQSQSFHEQLLAKKYQGFDGSMYRFMQVNESHATALAMTKARALLLKKWSEFEWYVDGD